MRSPQKIDPAKVLRAVTAASDIVVRAARVVARAAEGRAVDGDTGVLQSYAQDLDAVTAGMRLLEQEVQELQKDDAADDARDVLLAARVDQLERGAAVMQVDINRLWLALGGRGASADADRYLAGGQLAPNVPLPLKPEGGDES